MSEDIENDIIDFMDALDKALKALHEMEKTASRLRNEFSELITKSLSKRGTGEQS